MNVRPDALLRPATAEDLDALMGWFPDAASAQLWGGPNFRFPFTRDTFREDCRWPAVSSWSLVSADGALLAFGQYYEREGRAHLARLAVAPVSRGTGLGRLLIERMLSVARDEFDAGEASLFVYRHNKAAIGCYRALGFDFRECPEEVSAAGDICFMTAPITR